MRYVDTRKPLRAPLPLALTPWYLRLFLAYPVWRMAAKDGGWLYLKNEDYRYLFGRDPRPYPWRPY